MKVDYNKRLFWFLKEGSESDLNEKATLDMYIQQVLSHGRSGDIKTLLKKVTFEQFKEALSRVKHFLYPEVRMFWEDFIGAHQ